MRSLLRRLTQAFGARQIPCECRGWAGSFAWLVRAAMNPHAHHPNCRSRR